MSSNYIDDRKFIDPNSNMSNIVQKLAHIDHRERNRHEQIEQELPTSAAMSSIQTKPDEIILLEKQGLCSQKLRNNLTGNLAQVTHTVGQNMTDISNIDSNTLIKVEHISLLFHILNV